MIKFYCINKTKKYYELTNLTIRLRDGGQKDYSYTTDIRIIPAIFDFKEHGYPLKETKNNPERLQVNEKINKVIELMNENYMATKHLNLSNKDFKYLIDKVIFENEESLNKLHSNFADELDKYIELAHTTEERREAFRSVARSFRRFQYYYSFENGRTTNFRFCDINREVLNNYRLYLRNEYTYYQSSPEFFRDLTKRKITFRSNNTIIGILKKLHAFTNQFRECYRIDFDPFSNFKVGAEKYEDPNVLLDEEFEFIQNNEVVIPELKPIQRMFLLCCFLGLRYVDFCHIKKQDVVNGILHAYPRKTIKYLRKVEIPLNEFAVEIINEFSMGNSEYIVPCYTLDEYNSKLKVLFRELGLNRIVIRYNEEIQEQEHLPLCEVITSHFARRTFINTLINEGVDSITIKKLCGMSENSHEIKRYYVLNRKLTQECVNSLDKRKVISNVPTYQLAPYQQVVSTYQSSSII